MFSDPFSVDGGATELQRGFTIRQPARAGRARTRGIPNHQSRLDQKLTRARHPNRAARIVVEYRDGTRKVVPDGLLDAADSQSIFNRSGTIQRLQIGILK